VLRKSYFKKEIYMNPVTTQNPMQPLTLAEQQQGSNVTDATVVALKLRESES
jgi:hypothetical protein